MTSKEDQQVHAIIFKLAKLFRHQCALCHGTCKEGKGWVIHHRRYRTDEKTHGDFTKQIKSGRTVPDRLSYYKYLAPIVRRRKKDFALVHNSCHQAISRLARWKKDNRHRLVKMANECAN